MSSPTLSTRFQRIAEQASDKARVFTTLAHLIDAELLREVWLVDDDIRGCFDSVNHGLLQQILRQRVNDGGIVRLVGKWLKAGIQEGSSLTHPETGTPQGGVISPLLSNIFLHTVLDEW